ncbi:HSP20 family protein [Halobiforma haloterrestris]|uniref:HSP20 family protein n=1 Tax=Natronobacterium haloterrestre TaxID=148448 RepID=A0A1I1IH34_NATHA|nr:Hsp20/alpha crystallin family protein [Halobiforma haloterrestris]SFC35607.1 HSP20 family protein [Halobiforma haloterrestris]
MLPRSAPSDDLEDRGEAAVETLLTEVGERLEDAVRTYTRTGDERSRLDLAAGWTGIRLDLVDAGDELVVVADVPGYERDDLTVRLEGETLTISGDRSRGEPGAESVRDRTPPAYLRRERTARSFARRVRLPEPVAADDATASLDDGVLTVRLPKYASTMEPTEIDID